MKTIIENSVKTTGKKSIDIDIMEEFFMIIQIITNCESVESLKQMLKGGNNFNHFIYGYGGNHIWVKQKINNEPQQQVIFTEF